MATTPSVSVSDSAGSPATFQTFEKLFAPALLRKTARIIRSEIRKIRARDVVDWVDWFVSLEELLPTLSSEVISGSYAPLSPTRYELAKSHGAFRVITSLNMRDAVIYRHICDEALERAMPFKIAGAFFSRRHARTPIGTTLTIAGDDYYSFFEIWLKFNQYRVHTLLNDVYQVLVVTDITNYFDSIQHDLLIEYLAPLQLPRQAVGLLGRLLEAFKPQAGHSPNPRVGIPVDELDCSRELAHLFLFEHDARMTKEFGELNYVRWLDDQNVGVRSLTEARKVVNTLTRSLSSQRLTVNAGKTKFLTPAEVAKCFQLEANEEIDGWEADFKPLTAKNVVVARAAFEVLWDRVSVGDHVEFGYWSKILKRLYAGATKVDSDVLEHLSPKHLIDHPDLDERIFQYFAKRNQGTQLLGIFSEYCRGGENLFEGTESVFFESVLLLDPSLRLARQIRELALRFATGKAVGQSGRPMGRASAILALYWCGATGASLESLFDSNEARRIPKEVARAWLAVVAARLPRRIGSVQSKLVGHPSDDVARLSAFLAGLIAGTVTSIGNYKSQRPRWPLSGKYYDARSWLLLHVASSTSDRKFRSELARDRRSFGALARTSQEKRLVRRISRRLGARQ